MVVSYWINLQQPKEQPIRDQNFPREAIMLNKEKDQFNALQANHYSPTDWPRDFDFRADRSEQQELLSSPLCTTEIEDQPHQGMARAD